MLLQGGFFFKIKITYFSSLQVRTEVCNILSYQTQRSDSVTTNKLWLKSGFLHDSNISVAAAHQHLSRRQMCIRAFLSFSGSVGTFLTSCPVSSTIMKLQINSWPAGDTCQRFPWGTSAFINGLGVIQWRSTRRTRTRMGKKPRVLILNS